MFHLTYIHARTGRTEQAQFATRGDRADFINRRGDRAMVDEVVSYTAARIVAEGRDEHEACEAGTAGCSIDHTAEQRRGDAREPGCETW